MPKRFNRIGSGLYLIDEIPDGSGMRVARAFLQKMTKQFVRHSQEYYRALKDQPFAYRERQLHTVLFPAVSKSSSSAFLELPVTRHPRGGVPASGWVDYWARERQTVFLIEVKHGFHAFGSGRLRKNSGALWAAGSAQLMSLRAKEIRDQAFLDSDKIVLVMLLFVPTWIFRRTKTRMKSALKSSRQSILNDHEDVRKCLSRPAPSWSACWSVPEKMRMAEGSAGWYRYDAVHIFAKVKSI